MAILDFILTKNYQMGIKKEIMSLSFWGKIKTAIDFKTLKQKSFQPVVVNYPSLKYPFTRITEFKK